MPSWHERTGEFEKATGLPKRLREEIASSVGRIFLVLFSCVSTTSLSLTERRGVFDWTPLTERYNIAPTPQNADARAIASDFIVTGNDFARRAY